MSNQEEIKKAINLIAQNALTIYEALEPGTSIAVKVPPRKPKIITLNGQSNETPGVILITRPVVFYEFKAQAGTQEAHEHG